ncbi:MAG TPA: hypothetical protein VEU31_01250 [Candidatus Acidoferrales bacterium]|nr:hypothetical protein [Candidatus Acidoferrales bacterium]
MKLTGDAAGSLILEWLKEDVKRVSSSRHELGKFYFGVSTASMGVIVTLKKLEAPLTIDWRTGAALVFLSASAVIAVVMINPRKWDVGEDTDLFDEYNKQARQIFQFILGWVVTWGLGAAAGIYSLLHKVSGAGATKP